MLSIIFLIITSQFNQYYQNTWDSPSYIAFFDVNGDGHKDAILFYGDSLKIHTLTDNTLRGIIYSSPYEEIMSYVYTTGNEDLIVEKYTYNSSDGSYTFKIYYYTNYSTSTWESAEFVSHYYYYPYPVFTDMDGDGNTDIVISYRNADSTITTVIYKGTISGIKQSKNTYAFKNNNPFTIKFMASEHGEYSIKFYDISGRLRGTFHIKAHKGENTIIPPFISRGVMFYRIFNKNTLVQEGRIMNFKEGK